MSHLNVVRGLIDAKQKISLVKRFSFFYVCFKFTAYFCREQSVNRGLVPPHIGTANLSSLDVACFFCHVSVEFTKNQYLPFFSSWWLL